MSTIDQSTYAASGTITPAGYAKEITPSANDLPAFTTSIFVGGDGDLVVNMAGNDTEVTFTGVLAGTVLPIRVSRVAAATTATGIVGLYNTDPDA